MDPVDVVKRFEQAIDDRDVAALLDAFHADGTYTGAGAAATNLKGEEIGAFFGELFSALPDARLDVSTIFGAGDMVAVEWVYRGTMTGPVWGFSASGGSCSLRGSHIIRVEGDNIRSVQAYWDNHSLFEQLGIKPE